MNKSIDVLWRRLDVPGHDACQFVPSHNGWTLRGTSVFLEGEDACQLRYQVLTDLGASAVARFRIMVCHAAVAAISDIVASYLGGIFAGVGVVGVVLRCRDSDRLGDYNHCRPGAVGCLAEAPNLARKAAADSTTPWI